MLIQSTFAFAKYSGGDGSASNPWKISSKADLLALGDNTNDYSDYFVMTNDINLASDIYTTAIIAADINNANYEFDGTAFAGVFDGNDHKITGLTINGKSYLGLFGSIRMGLVKNLGIDNCSITGGFESFSVGALIGRNEGIIIKCYSTGSINGGNYSCLFGGLVGANVGIINYSNSACNVSIGNYSSESGGLLGMHGFGTMSNCFSTGAVTGGDDANYLGGLVGVNWYTIENCYSTGSVSGKENSEFLGGLIGYNFGDTISSYFSINSGPDNGFGTPLTDMQMKQKENFADWNFDFIWDIAENQTSPFFKHGGTPANPYQISNKNQLLTIANDDSFYDFCFILTADIDLQGQVFQKAIIAPDISDWYGYSGFPFNGIFDGNGHKISNFMIKQENNSNLGLFGCIGPSGIVKNLGLENVSLIGDGFLGGLAGINEGTINSCYANASVSGNYCIGALVGRNDGNISSCYSRGSSDGVLWGTGGFAGENRYGTINNCYSTCTVNSGGGLVGTNDLYDGQISSCFWDVEISGQTGSSAGKGLNSRQMKNMTIYQKAGWAGQGWIINDGLDYPHLTWENTQGQPIPPAVVPFDGNGTPQDPYLIKTAQEFADLSWYPQILDKNIKLMNDLDLSDVTLYPIGDKPFTGLFDGNDHIVQNITINLPGSNGVGIFGLVSYGGKICNLIVKDVNVTGNEGVGGLVGYNKGSKIENCSLSGLVKGFSLVGGLVGANRGNIKNCHSIGNITCIGDAVGGLVGVNEGIISFCYSASYVSGGFHCGGLAGSNGFYGTINYCYSTGNVSGESLIGGLVAENFYGSTINNCYATGNVSGGDYSKFLGGLVGHNGLSTINNCYSTSTVSCGEYSEDIGGLVGYNSVENFIDFQGYSIILGSFWDIQTSGQTTSDGGSGLTTSQMKSLSTFTSAGWDFAAENSNGTEHIWTICQNSNYPRFVWQVPKGDFACPYGIDYRDFAVLSSTWNTQDGDNNYNPAADLNKDNKTDYLDLALIADNWLSGI